MKKSNYTIYLPQKKNVLLFNSFTDSFLVIANQVYSILKDNKLNVLEEKYPIIYERFVKNGFLVDDNFDELGTIRLNHKINTYAPKDLHIVIFPTQDCNLKCWYCYENHVKNTCISEEVIDNILKYIEINIDNKIKSLLITFFGGEPLLNFDKVYSLLKKSSEICKKNNVSFYPFFITNASLIDENMVNKLREFRPMFQITIDGDKNKHDSVRIGKLNNYPTYHKIMKAIHLICKDIESEKGKRLLTFRINYDNQTLLNIDNIIKDIEDLDRKKIYIHLERVWQTRDSIDESQKELLKECIYKLAQNGFQVGHGVFGNKAFSCPAEVFNYAVINYNGLVYKCNGRTLTPETAEGELLSSGEIKWDQSKLVKRLSRTTFENNQCLKCPMLPKCMGPCSQKQMEAGWGNIKDICSMNSFDISIKDYLKLDFEIKYLLQRINKQES